MSWGKIILLKNKLEIRSISFQKGGEEKNYSSKSLSCQFIEDKIQI